MPRDLDAAGCVTIARGCRTAALAAALALVAIGAAAGQDRPPAAAAPTLPLVAERADESYTLTFFNREIVRLRARVAGRRPAERGLGASRLLHELVIERATTPVESRSFEGASMITVGSRGVLMLTSADVDDLAGETLDGVTAQTVTRLRRALDEAAEAHAPRMLVRAAATAATAAAVALLAMWILGRARRRLGDALGAISERNIARIGIAAVDAPGASRMLALQRRAIGAAFTTADLLVIYATTTFVLRQFPYTRAWGESMSGFLLFTVERLGLDAVSALPGLVTVAIILLVTRFVVRLAGAWFTAVEHGQAQPRWLHPDTAPPTRRLVTALLWVFAIVVAYPYMPGSQTEAFKGVSVFLGLIVTLGSSGLVNHIMSGFMITYSRAVRVGDFVRIGDVQGTVIHLGVLSTKVRSLWSEEVTIPNAVVVSQTTTDYSRTGGADGVFTTTSVTIGYDAPWRQVQALLLLAAERTPGLRAAPKPQVLQASLEDFYVKYTLLVCLEQQEARLVTLDALHANIQDLFNEHGVQIMSPNYMLDPAAPKVVPKEQWFAAPARPAAVSPPAHGIGTVQTTGSSAPAWSGGRPVE
jgi:small-conductance mechanosensitive channel